MMCLLSTASPNSGGTNPNAATNPSATFTTASEFSVHSPDSSSSSSSSGSSSDSSSSTTPSPPQLSPQIKNNSSCSNINQEKNPIFLDLLPKNNKENEEPLGKFLFKQDPKNNSIKLSFKQNIFCSVSSYGSFDSSTSQ